MKYLLIIRALNFGLLKPSAFENYSFTQHAKRHKYVLQFDLRFGACIVFKQVLLKSLLAATNSPDLNFSRKYDPQGSNGITSF